MSDEYIKKADAIELLNNSYVHEDDRHNWREHNNDCIDKLIAKFKELPTADVVERKRGEWIRKAYWSEGVGMGEDYGFYYECSNCREQERGGYRQCGKNFCPACGADMKGGNDE